MDPYLKEAQEKCNALEKIVKIQKKLINIQIILAFIIVCLVIFKNIFILKLFCLVPMFAISIICTILTEKARKLRNEISYEIIHRSIEAAELKGCEAIYDGKQTVKIVERKNEEKWQNMIN